VLSPEVGTKLACAAVGLSRATHYRGQKPRLATVPKPRPAPPRALSAEEQQRVLDVLESERFVDKSPVEVYHTLLDEGQYLCSVRTIYRVLAQNGEVHERRNQLRHPDYQKPELLATGPNQLWSWDITKLLGPTKWSYFYLYVVLDVFSRYVVGWLVADCENGELAQRLIRETAIKQGIDRNQLTLHSDRGAPMTSKTLAETLIDLGVARSLSRPQVSNDNPFSESQFKTMKYAPDFPDRFDSLDHSRSHCRVFFPWYNDDHRHAGIAYLTPSQLHHGKGDEILAGRARVLEEAHQARPERFVAGKPRVPDCPTDVWINRPSGLSVPGP
jgi:putative transposase